jgi:hypothetical protein
MKTIEWHFDIGRSGFQEPGYRDRAIRSSGEIQVADDATPAEIEALVRDTMLAGVEWTWNEKNPASMRKVADERMSGIPERLADRRFGVVVFDTRQHAWEKPDSGWISIGGGPPARICGPEDLAPDVIWLTDKHGHVFISEAEDLWHRSHLRQSDYLGTGWENIFKDHSRDCKKMPPHRAAVFASGIFTETMMSAYDLLRDAIPDMPMSEAFSYVSLSDDLKRLLPTQERLDDLIPDVDEEIVRSYLVEEIIIDVIDPVRNQVKDWHSKTLCMPRERHARRMLEAPVPAGPLERMSDDPDAVITDEALANLIASDRSMIARIRLPERKKTIFGGSGIAPDGSIWATGADIALIRRHARVEVRDVRIGRKLAPGSSRLPDGAVRLIERAADAGASWSDKVLTKQLCRAAARAEAPCPAGTLWTAERTEQSLQSGYIESWNHAFVAEEVGAAVSRGFRPRFSGFGYVNVSAPKERKSELGEFAAERALEVGFITPL